MGIADFVGLIGVAAYLAAYGLLQIGMLRIEDIRYVALNAIGSVAIMYSLLFNFNLSSFIAQFFWLILTIVGYIRTWRQQAQRS